VVISSICHCAATAGNFRQTSCDGAECIRLRSRQAVAQRGVRMPDELRWHLQLVLFRAMGCCRHMRSCALYARSDPRVLLTGPVNLVGEAINCHSYLARLQQSFGTRCKLSKIAPTIATSFFDC